MFKLQQVVELSVRSFGIDKVLKSINDLLDRNCVPGAFVPRLEDNAVGAPAYFFEYLVVTINVILQLLRLFHSEYIMK